MTVMKRVKEGVKEGFRLEYRKRETEHFLAQLYSKRPLFGISTSKWESSPSIAVHLSQKANITRSNEIGDTVTGISA